MKIELKHPYNKDFKSGYCYLNKEPRRVLALIKEDGERTSTSYARYLMSCKLGRYLKDEEHVDHKDDNPLNDDIKNLQILSEKENREKYHETLERRWIIMKCAGCKNEFSITHNRSFLGKNDGREYQFCSRSCSGKYSRNKKSTLKSNFKILKIFYK